MSIRETICNQLIELGFEAVGQPQAHSIAYSWNSNKAPLLFLDDSNKSNNGSSTRILFYSILPPWQFKFVHKHSAFHYWDIKAGDWVKIEDQTLDIATMIMLYA